MMLNFFNKYPYTDFHELNLDWLLDRMRKLEDELNDALETLSTEIYNQVMTDLQPTLTGLRNDLNALTNDYNTLRGQFEELDAEFDAFTAYVDAQAAACNEYTNVRIAQNNDYILSELTRYLSKIKVINFFTGDLVSSDKI